MPPFDRADPFGIDMPCSREEFLNMQDQRKRMRDEIVDCRKRSTRPGYEKVIDLTIGGDDGMR